ncbi:MAG: glycosyltransferase [Bacteroidia bacterium]|nr:glycosyltransferase [Bacteroidia bacterium]
MLVSVILPCYNPPENWDSSIIQEYQKLRQQIPDELELILVQDGANLNLEPGIKRLKTELSNFNHVQYPENRGKGYALRKGVETANGELIIYTDIDFPYNTESFLKIYAALKNDECDLAAGVKDESYYSHVPFSRRVLSKGLRWLIRLFLSIPFTDTQCGLKGFQKNMKAIFLKTQINRYLFDLEFIRLSHKRGYRVKPIKIKLNDNVHFRGMNYRVLFAESLNFLKLLFRPRYGE